MRIALGVLALAGIVLAMSACGGDSGSADDEFPRVVTLGKGGVFPAILNDSVTVGDRASQTVLLDQAELTADESLQIGNVTLTWKASAASQDEVTIGDDSIEAADNLAAAVNAHTGLAGLLTATSDGVDTVTITSALPGSVGEMVGLIATQASTGMTLGAANLAGITATSVAAVQDYGFGAV